MASEWREVTTVEKIKAQAENALATGPFGSSIGSRYFVDTGVPVIRGSNLSEDVGTRLNDEGLVYLAAGKAREFARCTVREGDLVFTCWGTVNQVGLVDKRAHHREYVISNKQMKFTPDPTKAYSLFLYYLFSGPELQHQIRSEAIGSSVPGFNLGQLRSMRLRLPGLPEQRAIAHILGTLDDKIELNRRMNETLEAMAQALFKSWFVDFDPVRAKAEGRDPGLPKSVADLFPSRLVESELGEIPEGWRTAPLPEVIAVNPTRSLRRGEVAPYLPMANMPTRRHSPDTVNDRPFGSGMRFVNGDTLVARITPCLENGKIAYVDFLEAGQVGWGSTEYIVLRPKSPLPAEFAYCLARDAKFREFAVQSMTGSSGRQRVPAESLFHFRVAEAPKPVVQSFGQLIRPLFLRASAAVSEARTLAALRDVLLPKLISGELRVEDARRFVGRAH